MKTLLLFPLKLAAFLVLLLNIIPALAVAALVVVSLPLMILSHCLEAIRRVLHHYVTYLEAL